MFILIRSCSSAYYFTRTDCSSQSLIANRASIFNRSLRSLPVTIFKLGLLEYQWNNVIPPNSRIGRKRYSEFKKTSHVKKCVRWRSPSLCDDPANIRTSRRFLVSAGSLLRAFALTICPIGRRRSKPKDQQASRKANIVSATSAKTFRTVQLATRTIKDRSIAVPELNRSMCTEMKAPPKPKCSVANALVRMEITPSDILCGRGKAFFNHGTLEHSSMTSVK